MPSDSFKIKQTGSRIRWLAVCGFLSVVWWNIIVLIAGSMYEGYDHLYRFQSELGMTIAPTAWFFNPLGCGLTGVLMIVFAIGLYLGKAGRVGSVFYGVAAVGWFILGSTPVDIAYETHMLGFVIVLTGFILSLLSFSVSMRRNERWRDLWKFTLIIVIVFVLFFVGHQNRLLGEFVGLSQRIGGWISNVWVLVVAYRLYRLYS